MSTCSGMQPRVTVHSDINQITRSLCCVLCCTDHLFNFTLLLMIKVPGNGHPKRHFPLTRRESVQEFPGDPGISHEFNLMFRPRPMHSIESRRGWTPGT